jgi:rare lipoprotein A
MRARRELPVPAVAQLAAVAGLGALPIIGFALSSSPVAVAKTHRHPAARVAHIARGPRVLRTAARFVVEHRAVTAQSGETVVVHGRLLPALSDVEVNLISRNGHRWRTVAHGRTHRGGRFKIRYRVQATGATAVRVSVARASAHGARTASASVGQIVGLEPSVASWYYDAGHTACGFHAIYGVANKTLPCGSRVTISYAGRSVVATVDDRGPYVYGRSFDLDQNTARYLGMDGVAQVLTSE